MARNDRTQEPLYSYAEADSLAEVSRGTTKRWIDGYTYHDMRGEQVTRPPIAPGIATPDGVSFLGLIEVRAIGQLKRAGLSLGAIRQIVKNCQDVFGVAHPLITMRFKIGGREIFVAREGSPLVEVGRRKGALAWSEFLEPFLRDVDYEDDLARRWWPLGRDESVVVDPEYGFGLPVIADHGVRTEIILERFQVGEVIEEIADDFGLSPHQVEQALRFEVRRTERAA